MGSRAAKHVKPQGGSAPKATPGSPGCRNPTDGWGLPGRKVRAHRNVPYHELGGDYFTRRDPERAASRAMTRLNKLGYRVTLDLVEATVPAGTKPGGHGPVWARSPARNSTHLQLFTRQSCAVCLADGR